MSVVRLVIGVGAFCFTAGAADLTLTVKLPTPRDHYKSYNLQKAGLKLMGEIMNQLDPESQQKLMGLMQSGAKPEDMPHMNYDQVIKLVKAHGLLKEKPEALELFLHASQVLDTIPQEYRDSVEPIVHDGLLAFMDGLPPERLLERAEAMARAKDASRGDKILILASKVPTLQKVGQIIGHLSMIPPDIQKALQSLENGISTISRDEMVAYITKEVGEDRIKKDDIQFADKILAEASVGAVIRGSFPRTPGPGRAEFVCKIVKPYVQVDLPQEMKIIDGLIDLATKYADFYNIKGFDLKDFFTGIRDQLEKEIQITQEQKNFKKAYEFYRDDKRVKVPEIYSYSTDKITFMEFLNTQKLVESFPSDKKKNAILAKRLATVMTFDAMFAKTDVAVFHGDPHGGNIMRLANDPKDPYRLAMLDWGLIGEFPRSQRMELVQLTLALQGKNKKKLMKNVGALIQGGLPKDPQKLNTIDKLVTQLLSGDGSTFERYAGLLEDLLKSGLPLDEEMSLFIKSQVTIAGILQTLDPTLSQDKLVKKEVGKLVMKELPKRLLLLPAINYRGYRSLLSNGEVCGQIF